MPESMGDAVALDDLGALPGGILVRQGLADLAAGRCSVASLLIDIARPRLTELGIVPRTAPPPVSEPERALYRLLRSEGGDAYSRYNALIRELISFQSALVGAQRFVRGSRESG
jgi:hypothetical protein